MIVKWILARLLGNLFGEGFGADLAGRGVVYLADGARSAVRKDDERVTLSRLKPGETYTVVARPRATRKERKLAASQRSLEQRYRRNSTPTRRQLRAAKQLERTQRKLDRTKDGSRRQGRLARREQQRGVRFDQRMRPTRRQLRLARELTRVSEQLDGAREENFQRARRSNKAARRRARVRVYD